MREIVIRSWEDLQTACFEGAWEPSVMRYRNNRVFRGVTDCRWDLLPSLNRHCPHNLGLEKHIIRNFRKYGYADLANVHSFWQLIAMGQQFGLPTRLLDWTYSPLVAAHFATEDTNGYDRDGAIVCCDADTMNKLLPKPLRDLLIKEQCSIFSMEMVDSLANDFSDLTKLSEQPFAFFFEPASAINRIANQYALFSITSDPRIIIDTLPGSQDAFTRIVIPAERKLEIRDKLDYINISERMIYPGLDGISKWIARRYAPLGPLYNTKRKDN
ncbi:MAG: FRG domain-containing protein [Christensenellales bacterium]|jgi:hypothetical protein|nr:FRG domain-containing protein [Clostridiales bacterium]